MWEGKCTIALRTALIKSKENDISEAIGKAKQSGKTVMNSWMLIKVPYFNRLYLHNWWNYQLLDWLLLQK